MTDFTPAAEDSSDDISALVADVFGLPAEAEAPPAGEPASVGTEGAAPAGQEGPGVSQLPEPAGSVSPTPTAEPGTGSAPQAPETITIPPQPAATPTPTPPAPDERDLRLQSLQAQVDQLLEAAKKPAETPAPAAGQQDAPAPDAPKPINVQLPDPLLGAIFGEDPVAARQGLNAVVSGLATSLNHAVVTQIAALRTEIMGQIQGIGQQSEEQVQTQTAATQRDDYFKTFPDHNKPVLVPILAQLSRELAAELPGVVWDDNFRNTLGARMNAKLRELGVPSATPPSAAPAPAPAPAAFLPQGARPERENEDDNIIMATLGGM